MGGPGNWSQTRRRTDTLRWRGKSSTNMEREPCRPEHRLRPTELGGRKRRRQQSSQKKKTSRVIRARQTSQNQVKTAMPPSIQKKMAKRKKTVTKQKATKQNRPTRSNLKSRRTRS